MMRDKWNHLRALKPTCLGRYLSRSARGCEQGRTRVGSLLLMANFRTPRVRPAEVPSCKVFNSSLFVVDASGSYETDFILPSSSPVRKRGILCRRDVTPARLSTSLLHDTAMDVPMKELEKLRASTESSTKGKTPSADTSLDSLLQSLYEVKSRIEAGTVTQDTFALLSQTVDTKKKEIDEKQKEVYNAIARLGKALDKV